MGAEMLEETKEIVCRVLCVFHSVYVKCLLVQAHVGLCLVWSDCLSCTHQEHFATIAKVAMVGAAQCDKTGKMRVLEGPLNIIRLC